MDNIERHRKIIHLLIEKGADKTLKDNNGKTAYDYAKESQLLNDDRIHRLLNLNLT